MKYKCENCDHTDDGDTFDDLTNPWERFEVGDLFTDKQCPECGSCAYPTDDPVVSLRYAAPDLLSALQHISNELWIQANGEGKINAKKLLELSDAAIAKATQP